MISFTETKVESKVTEAELSEKVMSNDTTPALVRIFLSITPLHPTSQVIPEINKEAFEFAVASGRISCLETGINIASGSGLEQDNKASVAENMANFFIKSIFYKITSAIHFDCAFITILPNE